MGYRRRHRLHARCLHTRQLTYHIYTRSSSCHLPQINTCDIYLTSKLRYYGVRNNSLSWFESYLSERKQFVDYDSTLSKTLPLETGVPQGSILGPLLFIIYMNDICQASSKFNCVLYADDTSLESPTCTFIINGDKSNKSISESIDGELALIANWLCVNRLSINVKKTKYILFHFPQRKSNNIPDLDISINGSKIERVASFNFLGITLNEHLCWKDHTNKVKLKISRAVGVMRRLRQFLPSHVLLTLYNTLILPHLQYGILLWGKSPHKLFEIQKKAVRVICNSKYIAHSEPLFKIVGMLKLEDIFILNAMKFYHKLCNDKIPEHFKQWFVPTNVDHKYNMRERQNSLLPSPKHKLLENFIKYLIPKFLTTLPSSITDKITTHSLSGFGNYIKFYCLRNYQTDCHIADCYVCNKP